MHWWVTSPELDSRAATRGDPGRTPEDFEGLLLESHPIISECEFKVLEMSQKCSYWKNSESVQAFCRFHGLRFITDVARCAYVEDDEVSALHQYRFASCCSMFMPRVCKCEVHQGLNDQDLSKLVQYPKRLAAAIVKWFASQHP